MSEKRLSDDAVAKLVTQVTSTMMGLSFAVSGEKGSVATERRTATISLKGGRQLTIALSANDISCARMGSAMFSVEPAQVDGSMKNDSLGELLNMISGQIQRAMSIDSALGLPAVHEAGLAGTEHWRTVRLRSGDVELHVAISE